MVYGPGRENSLVEPEDGMYDVSWQGFSLLPDKCPMQIRPVSNGFFLRSIGFPCAGIEEAKSCLI